MTNLFSPIILGDYELPNRVIMAPLTRGRAVDQAIPNDIMAEYYAQRASAGLIITEATAVARKGLGWLNAPGMFNNDQQEGWRSVANSVHEKGGRIFMQIWHMGAVVHPDFIKGEQPVSASDVKLEGGLPTPLGKKDLVQPRPMTHEEIQQTVQAFADTAKRVIAAGLDGVEIHAANGFLIDQFIRDHTNKRSDEYGGSIDNRLRFMLEVVDAVTKAIGPGKVGIRLSPTNQVWGISDSEYQQTFSHAVEKLNEYNLAYLHLLEPKKDAGHPIETIGYLTPELRKIYKGTLIINGGFTKETGQAAIENGEADAIAYGTLMLANPDLVERFRQDAPLNDPNPEYFYQGGATGYTDYPAL